MGHITPDSGGHITPSSSGWKTPTGHLSTTVSGTGCISRVKDLGAVTFPSFQDERVYMHPFYKNKRLPTKLNRWQRTVDAMLAQIETDEQLFLMIDQKMVIGGTCHRRAGPHVDGNWVGDNKKNITTCYPETILLASDVQGCVAYTGEFSSDFIGKGGDCSKVDLSKLKTVYMRAHRIYAGNLYMIHESLPLLRTRRRTLVRINVPHHKFLSL